MKPVVTSLVKSLLLALVLTGAAQLVWGLGYAWFTTFRAALVPREFISEMVQVRRDRTITVLVSRSRGAYWVRTLRTLDDQPYLNDDKNPVTSSWTTLQANARGRHSEEPLHWTQRVSGFLPHWQNAPREYWYLVADADGTSYLVGFDVDTRHVFGYLGRGGFRKDKPAADDQFPLTKEFLRGRVYTWPQRGQGVEPAWMNAMPSFLLCLPDEVVEVDLVKRTVTPIWKGQGALDAGPLTKFGDFRDEPPEDLSPELAIRTADRIVVVGKNGAERFSVAIPSELKSRQLLVSELPEGGLAVMTQTEPGKPSYVAWLPTDPKGKKALIEVAVEHSINEPPTWGEIGLAAPNPLALVLMWMALAEEHVQRGLSPTWPAALADEWPMFWPALAIVGLLSLFLGAMAWRRQRQYALGNELVWAAFVTLFGVPGWLGYYWHRPWPVVEKCPACGAMAPRDREACASCGKEFPPPERATFEIRG